MIGYYVHHHGRGHLHRAQAVASAWADLTGEEVVGLSSLHRPLGWRGRWIVLEPDDVAHDPLDPTAHGQLHWAPLGDAGLLHRMASVAQWLGREAPRALVVDVSVEVVLLARLLGVPAVAVVLPGRRSDPPHVTAFRAACALVACWPASADADHAMTPGLPLDIVERVRRVGAISRWSPGATSSPARRRRPTCRRARGNRRGHRVPAHRRGVGGLGARLAMVGAGRPR